MGIKAARAKSYAPISYGVILLAPPNLGVMRSFMPFEVGALTPMLEVRDFNATVAFHSGALGLGK